MELSREYPRDRAERVLAASRGLANWRSGCDEQSNFIRGRWSHNQPKLCQYCAQLSPDDSRGGCAACGGPRPEYKPGPIEGTSVNWRI